MRCAGTHVPNRLNELTPSFRHQVSMSVPGINATIQHNRYELVADLNHIQEQSGNSLGIAPTQVAHRCESQLNKRRYGDFEEVPLQGCVCFEFCTCDAAAQSHSNTHPRKVKVRVTRAELVLKRYM